MKETTCCFFGHRTICESEELKNDLRKAIENLITKEGVDTFLFGSKSRFDDLCLALVTELKDAHPHIKRIYVRAEYPYINDDYLSYLLKSYEDSYYPPRILGAGRQVYVERNCEIIDNSRFCIVYYHQSKAPTDRKSGTKIAFDYALSKKKEILLFPLHQ